MGSEGVAVASQAKHLAPKLHVGLALSCRPAEARSTFKDNLVNEALLTGNGAKEKA